jgi:molybdopterin-guanine dinucleotide biosynthesis protein A
VDAAILAGGRARRLGGADKSTLRVGHATILERQLDALAGVADRVFVVAGDASAYAGHALHVVPDRLPDAGALGGIYTALVEAESPHVLVIACDLPFLTAPLLARLAGLAGDDHDAVVPRTRDGRQPLCAVYARRLAETVRRQVESGHLKIQDLLEAIRLRELGPDDLARFDPDGRLFHNVNTPGDLELALRFAARAKGNAGR